MKKFIIIIAILGLLLVGAGGFAFLQWQSASELQAEVDTLKGELQSQNQQIGGMSRIEELLAKEKQFDAVKDALSGGLVLGDVETLVRNAKDPGAERVLGLGALRMMVKGKEDPSVAEAFERAIQMMDIKSRLVATCAAQAGLAATGAKTNIMSECAKLKEAAATPPAEAAPAEAAAAPAAPAVAGTPATGNAAPAAAAPTAPAAAAPATPAAPAKK
ncbi:MAG: Carbonic anhydrase precursor [Pseudomonadota bacterium]|jgi:flagellar basal body-associated protein FliL